ncbi:alginate lyase family protein [Pseudonocardia halophobica]|uniref:heparinase II/III family protein n=1 Tax=Pseudonocardia halophobica TaxID=29401 RepID=UPI003D89D098
MRLCNPPGGDTRRAPSDYFAERFRSSWIRSGRARDPLPPRRRGPLRCPAVTRLSWYARRLRVMSAGEMAWRAGTLARSALRRDGRPATAARLRAGADLDSAYEDFRAAAGRPVLLDRQRARAIAETHSDAVAHLLRVADEVCAGRVTYFGYPEAVLERPVDWNTDPISGTRWPRISARRIDHRSASGDPKWIWELNRLQHLPWLAEAWLFSGESHYAEIALQDLDGWVAQNRPGVGIAWRGAFEAGIRAISVAVALQGLRDHPELTRERYRAALDMLAESGRRCWADRSRFSSANNHLVGELAGLAVISALHPELADASAWRRKSLGGLAIEAERQILPDGAGAEQAFAYQLFTGDLLLVVAALLAAGGIEPVRAITRALDRSADFLSALVGVEDPPLRYGDDDEGFALRLDAEPVPDVRRHLAAVAAVTGNPQAQRSGRAGLTAAWFGRTQGSAPTGRPDKLASAYFPDGGLVLLRSGRRRITMDVGPLGYLAIAAHGHADALAVTITEDGVEIVGDPGAGSYYGNPEWRRRHRSTVVHGTLSVDDDDQSESGGAFLWTRHARVRVRGVDLDRGVVDAEHDGYLVLDAPVVHRRWLSAPPGDPTIVVVDMVTGVGRHRVRTAWPLHPDLDLESTRDETTDLDHRSDSCHVATRAGRPALYIQHTAPSSISLGLHQERGGSGPRGLGWWSDRLEARRPSWLVGAVAQADAPAVLASVLRTDGAGPVEDLGMSYDGDLVRLEWRDNGRTSGLTIHVDRDASCTRSSS